MMVPQLKSVLLVVLAAFVFSNVLEQSSTRRGGVASSSSFVVGAAADDDVDVAAGDAAGGDGGGETDTEGEAAGLKLDGMSADETARLREGMETFAYQAEVSRMMKLIINSLYKNKEIFLRELISNASDALDKVRFTALTDKDYLGDNTDLKITIQADKENKALHITDTGIGMTKQDLIKNLGTIAKSGTSEFFEAMSNADGTESSNLIGQFGVGFYSAFLVADTVVVTSKHNDDNQHIWESDASDFKITEDPREDEQLGRGTKISLFLKEEAQDYLEPNNLKDLIKRYSQFIHFDIYLFTSKIEQVEEEIEEEEEEEGDDDEAADEGESAEEGEEEDEASEVEEEGEGDDAEDDAPKTRMVDKTVWDWEIMNANKPIWTRSAKEVEDKEYADFYKSFTNDSQDPLGQIHFTAEGEVTFKSILFVPKSAPSGLYSDYGKGQKSEIKMYVRRVFITDEFDDLMPKYLSFVKGVVDSDDLPLNVSRETLQQHKLLKVIKKKLVRKTLEMLKKLSKEDYDAFWKEFGTSIKLGLIEDYSNRTRLAKLLRFQSSNSQEDLTSLEEYVERMKSSQESIYFVAGTDRAELEKSPFVERLLKKKYEVLYLTEPVDEYTIQNLPEFDSKKFQNVAKEGLEMDESDEQKEQQEELEKSFEPLVNWLGETLKDDIEKAVVSKRLVDTPCALVASSYGWSGNMERIMKAQAYAKAGDSSSSFYSKQKKTMEINARHPVMKKLLDLVDSEGTDESTENLAKLLFNSAQIRSGFQLADTADFTSRLDSLMRSSLGVDGEAEVEKEAEDPEDEDEEEGDEDEEEGEVDGEDEADEAEADEADAAAEEEGEEAKEDEAEAKDEL